MVAVELLPDIEQRIDQLFSGADRARAKALVAGAVLHDGRRAGARCQRCAIVAAKGSLARLTHFVHELKIDFRDVIVAGEYEERYGTLTRVRDLSVPFDEPVTVSGLGGWRTTQL